MTPDEAAIEKGAKSADKGFPPVAEKVICIDFDGTIVPWGQPSMGPKDPFPGVADAIRRFKRDGWEIVIFTSRLSERWARSVVGPNLWDVRHFLEKQYIYLSELLLDNGIPFDLITAEKVPAQHYVDDKAWRVNEYTTTAIVMFNIAILEDVA